MKRYYLPETGFPDRRSETQGCEVQADETIAMDDGSCSGQMWRRNEPADAKEKGKESS